MTYAMWGILTAMMLIFSVSFHRYRKGVARKQEIRWLSEHHVLVRLRDRLDLSSCFVYAQQTRAARSSRSDFGEHRVRVTF